MWQGQEANEPKEENQEGEAIQPDLATTDPVDVQPGDDCSDEGDASAAKGDTIRRVGADAGLLEEERPAVAEGAAVGDLR